jgi:hypothetical protein
MAVVLEVANAASVCATDDPVSLAGHTTYSVSPLGQSTDGPCRARYRGAASLNALIVGSVNELMLLTAAKELLPPRHRDASWAHCRWGLACVDENFWQNSAHAPSACARCARRQAIELAVLQAGPHSH